MMNEKLLQQLEQICERFEELEARMADPQVNPTQLEALGREYAALRPVAEHFLAYRATQQAMDTVRPCLDDQDVELRHLAREELEGLQQRLTETEQALQKALLTARPGGPASCFLEIRAGAGGHEAALFAGDLLRMYLRYAEQQGWDSTLVSSSPGEHGGYKEVICRIEGAGAHEHLAMESGVHRVQRVPETESQGRIHTSTCTVAVLPELAEHEGIVINPAELRIDTYRASGAGGQHVNKTDSAVRITHLPSGLVVESQQERSQHRNKARALSLLQARLMQQLQDERRQSEAAHRKEQVGSADRSERIRTYNVPQGRITDHRIGLTLYQLPQIMEGQLDPLITALLQARESAELADQHPGMQHGD